MTIDTILSRIIRETEATQAELRKLKTQVVLAPLNAGPTIESTIAAGAIAATRPHISLIPESGTADDLDTINNPHDGKVIVLSALDSGDTITVRDVSVSITGNIRMRDGANKILSNQGDSLALMYKVSTGYWEQIAASGSSLVETFLELTDTPASYVGAGGQFVKVTVAENGLEFVASSGGAVDSVNGQTGVVVLDTDDIAEGVVNFYFTDERAQDAVGLILTDSGTIDFTYDDVTPAITAIVIDASIDNTKLATMAANTVKTNNTGSVAAPADVDATTFLGQYINGATAKTTPVDADTFPTIDSEASNVLKKVSWANIKATLKTYLDTLYLVLLGKAGGQTAHGGTAASENLILDSTAHATKGLVSLQPLGGPVVVGDDAYVEPYTGFAAQNNANVIVRYPTAHATSAPVVGMLFSNNQTDGTDGNVSHINWMNEAIIDPIKTLARLEVLTDADIDDGQIRLRTVLGGVLNDALTIRSSGKVGFGTTTPSSMVEVATPNVADIIALKLYDAHNIASGVRLNLQTAASGVGAIDGYANIFIHPNTFLWNYEAGELRFGTSNAQRAVITSGGNIGFGTATPGVDVVGTFDITNTPLLQLDGATPRVVIRGSTDAGLNLIDTGAGLNLKWMRLITDGGLTEFQSVADAGTLQVDNILVLDHNLGQVMIGTATPVAGAELTVAGDVSVSGEMSANVLESSNWYSLGFGHHFYSDGGSPQLMVLAEDGKLGLGDASVPTDMIHIDGTAPMSIRIGDADDFTLLNFVSASQTIFEVRRASGDVLMDFNVMPTDNLGAARMRLFRTTNTTGIAEFLIHKANGANVVNCALRGNNNSYLNADNGNVGIGIVTATGKLHVDQDGAAAAIPVLVLQQQDVDQDMIEFVCTIGTGNAIEAVGAKTLTTTHFIKVTLPGGLTRYFPVGTIA